MRNLIPTAAAAIALAASASAAFDLNSLFDRGVPAGRPAMELGLRKAPVPKKKASAKIASFDIDKVLASLPSAWAEALGELKSTSGHAAFFQERGIEILIVPSTQHQLGKDYALYDHGKIYANRDVLLKLLDELQASGASEPEAVETLAWRLAPFIAHELRHAMTTAGLEEAAGMPLEAALGEGEVLSFADQFIVQSEASKARPQAWKRPLKMAGAVEALVAEAAAGGMPGIETFVEAHYGFPFLLKSSRQALRERYEAKLGPLQKKLDMTRKLKERLSKPDPVKDCVDYYRAHQDHALSAQEEADANLTCMRLIEDAKVRMALSPYGEEEYSSYVDQCRGAIAFYSKTGWFGAGGPFDKAQAFFKAQYEDMEKRLKG